MYKLFKSLNGELCCVIRTTDNVAIPLAPDNSDYQAYLKWVAEGNTPEAAE